jgi:hypothetical protein
MSVYIPAELRRQVREQFANCCAYCDTAEELTGAVFESDHILPIAPGGTTSTENLCLAGPTCNRYKSIRRKFPDPAPDKTAPLYYPQVDRWSEHFTWNETATHLVGLTPTGRATIAALNMNRAQLIRLQRIWVKLSEHPPAIE